MDLDKEHAILLLGFVAQMLFTSRFLVQWIVSERRRESVIPMAFWYFSLGGGSLLLIYAILRQDPVFIFGQAGGTFVYVRNILLVKKKNKSLEESKEVENLDELAS